MKILTVAQLNALYEIEVDPNRVQFGPLAQQWEYFERERVNAKGSLTRALAERRADMIMRAIVAELVDPTPQE